VPGVIDIFIILKFLILRRHSLARLCLVLFRVTMVAREIGISQEFDPKIYSYRKAMIGSRREAFQAG
jgi:hypothetical protein